MQVIDVPIQILIASNRVLPEAALPDGSFSPCLARCTKDLARTNPGKVTPGEVALDLFPPQGVI